jgi:hypothetical protein
MDARKRSFKGKKEKEEKGGLLTHEYLKKSTDFQRLTGRV